MEIRFATTRALIEEPTWTEARTWRHGDHSTSAQFGEGQDVRARHG